VNASGDEIRCDAPALREFSRALRTAARVEVVAEAEHEVGAAWAAELLRLRYATRSDLAAERALLDVIDEELCLIADAADRREELVRAGRIRVAAAREAVCRPRPQRRSRQ
jgi:hypothetical protein